MLSGSCGTRDEPYIPRRRADASVLKRGLSWGHLLNIYKLKATPCGLFASGNRVPEFTSGVGCGFRLRPRWETASHSKGEFRDTLSETPSIRKARPTLNTSSEHMRACCPERPRHRGDGKYRPRRLPSLRPRVSRKKPRGFRGFHHLYCFARRTANGEATLPARPSWRLQPCCPDLPWWDGPSRQPSCRAASYSERCRDLARAWPRSAA